MFVCLIISCWWTSLLSARLTFLPVDYVADREFGKLWILKLQYMYVHYQGSVSHKKWQGSRSLKFYSLPHLPPPSVMHSYPLTTPSSSGKNVHTVACASSTVRTYLHLLLGSDLSRNALTYVTYVTLTYIQYVIELAFMSGGGGVGHGLKPRWDDCQAWDQFETSSRNKTG